MNQRTDDNFETHFETLELDDETLRVPHGETIVPADASSLLQTPQQRLKTLPRLALEGTPETIPDLRVGETLGEGGMGLVRLATQVVLEREVAVKTLRASGDDNASKLLQEAYVTGKLEHPNVIPIYTLGKDDDGAPLIVMKRIEGVSWLEVNDDPNCAPEGEPPDLPWHLDVLLQVCNALRYAHSHDVIHRDIKLENVMIGRFGEVYLLDWGIAVSIAPHEDQATVLPHRNAVHGLCGTPAYMAPELTNDDAAAHDVRTDVYLLGATLHHVLVGEPRHTGKNLFEVMRSAFESKPYDYPEDVPGELAAIANRAMAKAPDDRFSTVDAFRQALLDYIEHRASHELADEAAQLLAEIEEASDEDAQDDEEAELHLHDLFIECRFACQQALRAWPDNPNAAAIHARFLERSFRHAIARGDLLGAQSALSALESATAEKPELRDELAALTSERESEREEFEGLREFAAELDLRRGRVSRSLAVLGMGALWSTTVLYTYLRFQAGAIDDLMQNHIASTWRALGIGVAALFLFRKPLFSTAGNRRFAYLVILTIITIALFRTASLWYPEIGIGPARSFEIIAYGVAASALGIMADDLRISLLACVYFVIALIEPWVGDHQLLVTALYHLVFFGAVAWVWTPSQIERRWSI